MDVRRDSDKREESGSDAEDPGEELATQTLPVTVAAPAPGLKPPAALEPQPPSPGPKPPAVPEPQPPSPGPKPPAAPEPQPPSPGLSAQRRHASESAEPSPPRYTRDAPPLPPQRPRLTGEPATPVPEDRREVTHPACNRPPESASVPAASQAAETSEMRILRSQLKVLGATQILMGLIQLVFGVPLTVSMVYSVAGKSGVSFWIGIWFIISGALTVQLRRRSTRWNMKATLLMNGVSAVATAIGIIIYSVSLLFMPAPEFVFFSATTFSLTIGLLLFTVLEMGIAAIVAFYSYRSLFHFQSTYTILHDVITRHPSHQN